MNIFARLSSSWNSIRNRENTSQPLLTTPHEATETTSAFMKSISLPQELQCEVMQQCSSGNLSRLGISNITFATECRMKYLTSSCSPNLKRYVCSRRDAVPILYRDLDLSYCIVPAIFYSYPEDVIGEANRPDRRINST
jgi:hypothetical protein